MSTRREYVRQAAGLMLAVQLIRGDRGDVPRAIAWATALADQLTAAGYGWTVERAARQSVDWLARLSEPQRAAFEQFWSAWRPRVGATGGKQAAARRWAEIDPSEADAALICAAAAADAARPREAGEKRKWAEGWLHERRWADHAEPAAAAPSAAERRAKALAEARGELTSLERLSQGGGDFSAQIARLRAQIESLRGAP